MLAILVKLMTWQCRACIYSFILCCCLYNLKLLTQELIEMCVTHLRYFLRSFGSELNILTLSMHTWHRKKEKYNEILTESWEGARALIEITVTSTSSMCWRKKISQSTIGPHTHSPFFVAIRCLPMHAWKRDLINPSWQCVLEKCSNKNTLKLFNRY